MSIEVGPLHISGEQYWNHPESAADATISKRLDDQADGMILDAPPKVDLSVHPSVPILCHRSGDTRKLFIFNLNTTTQLVVSHLESGDLQVVKLGTSPARRKAPVPSPGWTTDWLEQDLIEWVNLGPKLGRYNLWLACGPEASNQRTIEILAESHTSSQRPYIARIQEINSHNTVTFDTKSSANFAIEHAPLNPPPRNDSSWILTREPDPKGGSRLRIQFRIPGLPGLVFPPQEKKTDPAGRHIYGHLPSLVFGFGKDRILTLNSLVDLPIIEKPEGTADHPILSGNISFRLADLEKAGIRDEPQNVWAVSLDHRAYLQVKPLHLK